MVDKTSNTEDLTHPYFEIGVPVKARYLKIINYRVPGGTFAISGFRVFGNISNLKPEKINSFKSLRTDKDPRTIKLLWKKQSTAIGYNIRFGVEQDKLYHSYQVYSDTSVTIRSLNANLDYWFKIDAFNENGISYGQPVKISNYKVEAVIEAEDFSGQSGIQLENCSEGGKDVAFIDNGDYTFYNDIDFGEGVTTLNANVASNAAVGSKAGAIDVRIDSASGALLGTIKVPGTGDWQKWITVSCKLTGATGVHKIYLIYKKGGFNINWFQLKKNSSSKVIVYQNSDYDGWSVILGAGSYKTADIVAAGGQDNEISSVKVPAGWKTTLYDFDNFSGDSIVLLSDNSNLFVNDFIERVSSIKITDSLATIEKPIAASNPQPEDLAIVDDTTLNLSWNSDVFTSQHNIYLDTTNTLTNEDLISVRMNNTFHLTNLSFNKTYYWRIDEVNCDGVTPGKIWSFSISKKKTNINNTITNGFHIYPNPVTGGKVFLSSNEKVSYRIITLLGDIVQTGLVKGHEIKLLNFKPGIYFLSLSSGNVREIKQLIVK